MNNIELKVVGRASDGILIQFSSIFNLPIAQSEIVLFCDFSDCDIPIGYTFKNVDDRENNRKVEGTITLKKVTQQFGRLFELIPEGWKTICLFSFSADLSPLLLKLPVVSNWYDSKRYLILS